MTEILDDINREGGASKRAAAIACEGEAAHRAATATADAAGADKYAIEPPTFQDVIMRLQAYWAAQGCVILQPYDNEVGAGTNAPATTLRALGPDTWRTAYVQGCRRPTDGRYGENPNRLQFYYQFQVLIKPSPDDIQDLYLGSLRAIGIDTDAHDVRFVEDDWESPTLGAWGLGWEVWIDGMEVTQFTYFQQVGGFECDPVPAEVAYGLERLTMFVQGVDSVYDIVWARGSDGVTFTYGDVYLENEREWSRFNFEVADTDFLFREFAEREAECARALEAGLPIAAYDDVLKCSHTFNLLDARGVISATERTGYILRVRTLAKAVCESYMQHVIGEGGRSGSDGHKSECLPNSPQLQRTQAAPSANSAKARISDSPEPLRQVGEGGRVQCEGEAM